MSKASHSAVDKDILLSMLSRLGIQINKEKSSLTPQHEKTYIGFIVSTEREAPIISIPHIRIYKLKRDIKRVLSKTSVSARTLARVAGQCIALTKAIIPGKLLQNVYQLLATRSTWDDMFRLNTSATEDLQWWLNSLQNWNRHPLQVRPPQGQMFTDASHIGWGAVYGLKERAGHWNLRMSLEHSNYRELLMALKSFGLSMKEKQYSNSIRQCDHSGIYQSSWRSQLRSDRYSKGYIERGIQASDLYFCKTPLRLAELPCTPVIKTIPPIQVAAASQSVSSSRSNLGPTYNLPKYNCRFLDPFSSGIDVISQQDRDMNNNFINAPLMLIPKTLSIIKLYKAGATIIASHWPAQPWFQH